MIQREMSETSDGQVLAGGERGTIAYWCGTVEELYSIHHNVSWTFIMLQHASFNSEAQLRTISGKCPKLQTSNHSLVS
jgi:hypothetical protein